MSKRKERVFVIGVGMTKFEKPGSSEGWDYPQMVKESATLALEDGGVTATRSSRSTPITCTATRPVANALSRSWA